MHREGGINMECNKSSALVMTGTAPAGSGLRDRSSRYCSKGLDCAESRLGIRFSKYFSASGVIQAVQNDDDVLNQTCQFILLPMVCCYGHK